MIRQTAHFGLLVLIYLLGILITFGVSIWFLFIDYAGKDWLALLIVMPFAWLLSYWPMAGSFLMIIKLRRIQNSLDEIACRARQNSGQLVESDRRELVEVAVEMAVNETGMPRFLARRAIGWLLTRMAPQAHPTSATMPLHHGSRQTHL